MTSRYAPSLTEEEQEEYEELLRNERACYAVASEEKKITHGMVISKENDGSYTVEALNGGKRLGSLTYPLPLQVGNIGIMFEEGGEITFIRKPPD